jgi:putative chitinase
MKIILKEVNMQLTTEQFKQLFPRAAEPEKWVASMNAVFPAYQINTPRRIAAFLAQCGHESGGWTIFEENLNYSAKGLRGIFKKYFPNDEIANEYARQPRKIANRVYANRMGNGPESSDDGWKYRGRGPIQLTGRNNYTAFAKDMFEDWENVVENPDWVTADRDYALMSAIWFWNTNKLNRWADDSATAESTAFITLTRRINGGTIGLDCRQKHFKEAMEMLAK